MQLTVHERLKLMELLPMESTYAGVMEIRRASMLLQLTGEEAEQIEATFEDGHIQWNQDKALTLIVDVPMGEWMTETIRLALREKDHEGTLDPSLISLFEKFILDYE